MTFSFYDVFNVDDLIEHHKITPANRAVQCTIVDSNSTFFPSG